MWSDFRDSPASRNKTWSKAHTDTSWVFCGGLRCEILKKIRKKAKFEVLIFYYKSKRKKKSKERLDRLKYIKRMISESEDDSESYFLHHERI
jgi:hypothetical protein